MTMHREVTSVDVKSNEQIEGQNIECHPLAVSLKISSSTKIQQQPREFIKEECLNTQFSKEQIGMDFFSRE